MFAANASRSFDGLKERRGKIIKSSFTRTGAIDKDQGKVFRQSFELLSKRSARYEPVFYEVAQHRGQLAIFGLWEVCAVKIDSKELEWEQNVSFCLGSGAFSDVYQGTMRRDGEVKTVAVKVWNKALDFSTAEKNMEVIRNLR